MAHLVQNMAYVGETPWHQLGNQLPAKQPIEVWAQKAGMDWTICETPVRYMTEQAGSLGSIMSFDDQKVLYRSDTKAPLSVVSGRYQVVQPKAVLEFYRDLTEISGFELETAGVLKEGKKFWALAKDRQGNRRSRATMWSRLHAAGHLLRWHAGHHGHTHHHPGRLQQHPDHCTEWRQQRHQGAAQHQLSMRRLVKKQLGIAVSQWDSFMYRMKTLSERKVKSHESMNYFLKVLCQTDAHVDPALGLMNERALKKVQALYEGHGQAPNWSLPGTAWGLLNAVTEFVDHERRARSQEYRWTAPGSDRAPTSSSVRLDHALQLAS
jgi:hypothetical protein